MTLYVPPQYLSPPCSCVAVLILVWANTKEVTGEAGCNWHWAEKWHIGHKWLATAKTACTLSALNQFICSLSPHCCCPCVCVYVCVCVCVLSLSLSFKSLSSLNLSIYFNFFVSYPFFSSFSFRSRLASHSPFAQPLLSFVSFTLSQSHILFLPTFLSTFLLLFSLSFSQFFHWFSFLFLSVIFLPHSLYPHFTLRSL